MEQSWTSQLPLVAAFVFFCLTLIKLFLDFLKTRDDQWQRFLIEQRQNDRAALSELAKEVHCLAEEFAAHDHETRGVIGILKDRRARGKPEGGQD